MKKERYIFMIKLWDSLKSKTQQMLLEQENEELKWEQKYKKEHKLRQEAEGEMSILKTISVHSSPEMRDAKEKIKDQCERLFNIQTPEISKKDVGDMTVEEIESIIKPQIRY